LGLALCFSAHARIPYDEYVRNLVSVEDNLNCSKPLANAVMPPNFCVQVFASGLSGARGVFIADNNDVLVQSSGSVVALWDDNHDGIPEGRATIATASGLNHAVYVYKNYLYATSMTTCYRWRYTAGQRTNLGSPEIVVKNIPPNHHVTRVIIFDEEGRLYVHCGSEANVAPNDLHSRIHRFNIANIPSGGIDWSTGEYFAGGLRNENGLRFDEQQRLWGVENGRDDLSRGDLGGDIHNDNPGEELNMFDKNTPGKFYGYPRCWSVFNLTYQGRTYPSGTQFADPGFMPATTDAWCQNTANVVPPQRVMDAHMAPLDIFFWPSTERTWPNYAGDAFIAYHGSWNRNPASGYLVEHITFQNGRPVANAPFLGYKNAPYSPPNSWIRPVALGRYKCIYGECLIVSSDSTGQLLIISYTP
jgi:glucose/arabinose dehydrogenase